MTDATLAHLADVRLRYAEHRAALLAQGRPAVTVDGVDLALLDDDVAECVEVWLDNGGILDEVRWNRLTRRLNELDRALPLLTREAEVVYYTNCRSLALRLWEADNLPPA